jgi:leucyl/phenylalanyl-tRNA--protein transferase
MPVFRLTEELVFPDPSLAEDDGLLAVGGDLSVERLLLAYSMGIFPWYDDSSPILWWSPDPRLVLKPSELLVSRSLRQTLKKGIYSVTFDRAFADVIRACAQIPRRGEEGTWITQEMMDAYVRLHEAGHAHSVESWRDGKLAGGLYGVSLGGVFFGESMFSRSSDSSKAALVALAQRLNQWHVSLIDCQVTTGHLVRMGAALMPRSRFCGIIRRKLDHPVPRGSWDTVPG